MQDTQMKELRELLAMLREEKVAKIRFADGLEVEMSPGAFAPALPDQSAAPVGVENGGEPTDEQMLMWSAPGGLPKAQQPEAE